MKYVLDTNIFISASQRHYRFSFLPGFWFWIIEQEKKKLLCSFEECGKELRNFDDELANWAKKNKHLFLPPRQGYEKSLKLVADWSNNSDRTNEVKNRFMAGVDFKLIAFAHSESLSLVTEERPEPTQKGKIKIPDVCNDLGISWISPWDMFEKEKANFGEFI